MEFTFPQKAEITDGSLGKMRRFVCSFGELKNKYAELEVTEEFGPMSVVFEKIGYHPELTRDIIREFNEKHSNIDSILKNQPMPSEAREWFEKAIQAKAR